MDDHTTHLPLSRLITAGACFCIGFIAMRFLPVVSAGVEQFIGLGGQALMGGGIGGLFGRRGALIGAVVGVAVAWSIQSKW
jgi:hypothetical protein